MENPNAVAADALKWAEVEATSIMEEFADQSPYALAQEVAVKRDVFEGGADFALAVADVLRSRQDAWLRGRRWLAQSDAVPGAPELTRTSEHAQVDEWSEE